MPDVETTALECAGEKTARQQFGTMAILLDDKIYVDEASGRFIILAKRHPIIRSLIRWHQPPGHAVETTDGKYKFIPIRRDLVVDLEMRATAALMVGSQHLADGWELQSKPPRAKRRAR
jgi:hypothetical protein